MPFALFGTDDPSRAWRELHQSGETVFQDEVSGLWVICGYREVRAVLADARQYSNAAVLAPICPVTAATGQTLAALRDVRSVITVDPPRHAEMRAVLNTVFPHTRADVRRAWGDVVSRRVNALIDDVADAARVDLKDFSVRLTVSVICDVLGLPVDDQHSLRLWTDSFAQLAWSNPVGPVQRLDAENAVAMWRYCQHTVQQRAATGDLGDGVVGDLLRYRDSDGAPLSLDEVAGQVLNLIGAGWETNAGAICHVIEQALTEPDRWARLAADHRYLDALVTEVLRLLPPIVGWQRLTTADVSIGNVTIPAGSRCLLLLGAANHDPSVFPQPERLDPDRNNALQNLAFGFGAHRCLGAHLARLVITTAVQTLARRLPQLRLSPDHQPQYLPSAALLQHRWLSATTGVQSGCPIAHGDPDVSSRPGTGTHDYG